MRKITASPKKDDLVANCIRKFSVHFRRPYEIGQTTQEYKGEFGFDWVRDEYIYPILAINGTKDCVIYAYSQPSLRILYENFYQDVNEFIEKEGYLPSWLSIFATDCKGTLGSEKINEQGVSLDLEIHQSSIDACSQQELTSNGTVLTFRVSNDLIKISTFNNNQQTCYIEEPLSKFIDSKRLEVNLGTEKRYLYKKNKAITIRCSGGVLTKNESIKVTAKRGETEYDVGIIYIAKNDKVAVASLVIIDVKVNGKVLKRSNNYEWELKNRIFNQCLMIVEVVKTEIFDLDLLSKNDPEVRDFVKKWWTDKIKIAAGEKYLEIQTSQKEQEKENLRIRKTNQMEEDISNEFERELRDLYERKRQIQDRLISIHDDIEKRTYVFFAPIALREPPICNDPATGKKLAYPIWSKVFGTASYKPKPKFMGPRIKKYEDMNNEEKRNELKWGNIVTIFSDAMNAKEDFVKTFSHELSHSFGLLHSFDSIEKKIQYYQGFTDNIMDYPMTDSQQSSKFSQWQFAFRKDQADKIRQDNNVDNGTLTTHIH